MFFLVHSQSYLTHWSNLLGRYWHVRFHKTCNSVATVYSHKQCLRLTTVCINMFDSKIIVLDNSQKLRSHSQCYWQPYLLTGFTLKSCIHTVFWINILLINRFHSQYLGLKTVFTSRFHSAAFTQSVFGIEICIY